MKLCPNCKQQMDDNLAFCMNCGSQLPQAPFVPVSQPIPTPPPAPNQTIPPQGTPYMNVPPMQGAPVYNPYDHTAAFTAKDISDNKVISMLVYLMGVIGIIIALLAANSSPYAAFHVRQSLKITVITILLTIVTAFLFWTFIVPILAGIALVVLTVVKIICFFQVCNGKAMEPVIIRNFTFLK